MTLPLEHVTQFALRYAATDTDTDRVPSHTSRRDRRDDQCWRNPSRTFLEGRPWEQRSADEYQAALGLWLGERLAADEGQALG